MPDIGLSFDLDTSSLEGMFPATKTAVRQRLAAQVTATAFKVVKDAQDEIETGERTGKTYKRGATTRSGGSRNTKQLGGLGLDRVGGEDDGDFIVGYKFHRASAPGEAPAADLGALANSGHVEDGGSDLEKEAVFGTAYGAAMEFGTVAIGGFIEARPFVGPACDKNDEPFYEGCRRAVAEGMAEGSQGSK